MGAQEKAAENLSWYLRRLWPAELNWGADNDAEVADVVGLIVSAARELPPLDSECGQCGRYGADADCPGCDGTGTIITDAGRQVIAFLQRHPAALTRVEG